MTSLEHERWIEPLISRSRFSIVLMIGWQLRLGFVEFVVKLDDLVERGCLFLRLARLIKKAISSFARDTFSPRN